MPITNLETALAAALGVSGTLSARRGLFPITPLTMIWRRQVTPADALLSAVTTQAGIALAERTVAVAEGQWVSLDSSGNAVIADSALGGGSTGLAWPVFSGGDRLDMKGGLTVLHGKWVAHTSFFDQAGTYAVGTLLKVNDASAPVTVQGVAGINGALQPIGAPSATENLKVVARVERTAFGVAPETPAGTLQVSAV
jgi:hypothetical protein